MFTSWAAGVVSEDIMTFLAFCVLVLVVCAIAALVTWIMRQFLPNAPALVEKIVWGVAVLIILVTLLQAIGIVSLSGGPMIPRLK